MWFFAWWWLIPLFVFLAARGGHGRWHRERRWLDETVFRLRQTVESQAAYIEELEARLSRVEDGLEFTERLLAERTGTTR